MTVNASYCQLASFFIGIAKICYMTAPVGQCDHCCPQDDVIDIQYKLFTRSNPDVFQLLPLGDINALSSTAFDPSRPTVIYLMGFSEATDGPSTTLLKNSYLTSFDYNFIAVDWSRLIAFPCFKATSLPIHRYVKLIILLFFGKLKTTPRTTPGELMDKESSYDNKYITAVRNTVYMGNRLARFIQFLETAGVPAPSLHIIGFSLGAEAAGFAGKNLKARGIMIGRITGLDPAYPGYSLTNSDGHLTKGDALFVDVVHTNPGIFGFPQAIGDVDFYPNAGSYIQPGCWVDQLIKNREFRFIYGCSHIRAWRLYAESIGNPRGFPATLCRDWKSVTSSCRFQTHGYMGFSAGPSMAGKMYLETNEKSPFARNGP